MVRFIAKMAADGWAVFDGGVQVTAVNSKLSARRKAAALNRKWKAKHGG
jgi:hypothetical protein